MSGTGLEVSPDMDPEDVLAHYGKKGMQWGVRKQERLERLERVSNNTASKGDLLKTGAVDIALGSSKSQVSAQIRAAKQMKSASESGEAVTKAALKYYGTRTMPQVAALTFNRAPKMSKTESDAATAAAAPAAKKAGLSAGQQSRLDRLERVASGTASKGDAFKTASVDIALGSAKSQIGAQIRAAQSLKTAKEAGSGTTKAMLNYYGTRTMPQVAALTFNRKPKS